MSALFACVYRIYDADDVLLYVGHTQNIEARMRKHTLPASSSFKAWGHRAAWVAYTDFMDRFEALRLEAAGIESERPVCPSPTRGPLAYAHAMSILTRSGVPRDEASAFSREAFHPEEPDCPPVVRVYAVYEDVPLLPVSMAAMREAIERLTIPRSKAS